MRRTNKKGFTIVELVIVIAVIAILAAVLIPTFSSLVKKANLSADQQAVKQMNTVLAACVDAPSNIADVKTTLAGDGIDANNYKPLSAGYEFYWDKGLNRIVMVDENDSVVYPEDAKNKASADKWVSLSGNGNQTALEALVKDAGSNETVTLSGTTNFKGASMNITPVGNLTIGGESAESPATLQNFVSDEGSRLASNTGIYAEINYYAGMISEVKKGQEVTVENLVIDGAVIGDTTQVGSAWVGIIAGSVSGTLTIKNVTIKNCTVFGMYRIGALVGGVTQTGKVIIENVTIEDTNVKGTWITAALVGQVHSQAQIEINNVTTKNLNVVPSEYNLAVTDSNKVMTVNGSKYVTSGEGKVGYPYLTDDYYWLVNSSDNITSDEYPGIKFWNYTPHSNNYSPQSQG